MPEFAACFAFESWDDVLALASFLEENVPFNLGSKTLQSAIDVIQMQAEAERLRRKANLS